MIKLMHSLARLNSFPTTPPQYSPKPFPCEVSVPNQQTLLSFLISPSLVRTMAAQEASVPTTDTDSATPIKRPPHEVAQQVLDDHQTKLFRPTQTHISVRDIQVPESFFQPTSTELSNVLQTYSQRTQQLQNAVMKTKKMRQAEEEQRMKRFRNTLIRIQMPDRFILQGVFQPRTTIRQVVRFVRAALIDAKNVKFHFFVVPPKRILSNPDATLWSEGFVPAAIIHMGIDDGPSDTTSLLKPGLLSAVADLPELLKGLDTEEKGKDNGSVKTASLSEEKGSEGEKTIKDKNIQKKVPKWFKK